MPSPRHNQTARSIPAATVTLTSRSGPTGPHSHTPPSRHRLRYVAASAAALALFGCASSPAARTSPEGHARVQQALDVLTHRDGFPGALIEVRDTSGHSWVSVSGVAELGGQQPVPRDGQFRIGSTTKTFVATVVLQLVAGHRVQLDAPIERYLPGLVRGHGNDGRLITVRELLQHTSGLPDYVNDLPLTGPRFVRDRFHRYPATAARGARPPAPAAVQARRCVVILQHQLHPARAADRKGHRPSLRIGDHPANPGSAGPARHAGARRLRRDSRPPRPRLPAGAS